MNVTVVGFESSRLIVTVDRPTPAGVMTTTSSAPSFAWIPCITLMTAASDTETFAPVEQSELTLRFIGDEPAATTIGADRDCRDASIYQGPLPRVTSARPIFVPQMVFNGPSASPPQAATTVVARSSTTMRIADRFPTAPSSQVPPYHSTAGVGRLGCSPPWDRTRGGGSTSVARPSLVARQVADLGYPQVWELVGRRAAYASTSFPWQPSNSTMGSLLRLESATHPSAEP